MKVRNSIQAALALALLTAAPLAADTLSLKPAAPAPAGPQRLASSSAVETIASDRLTGSPTLVALDDDSADGEKAPPGYTPARIFETPSTGEWYIVAVSIHGGRFGPADSSRTMCDITLCDSGLKPITTWQRPYSAFPQDKSDWVRSKLPPTPAPRRFGISFSSNPTVETGVSVSFDEDNHGHSFYILPGQPNREFKRGDWMIRVELDHLAEAPKAGEPGAKDRETVLDRKVHIEKDLILNVPDKARLCDGMDVRKLNVDIGGCKLYCEREGKGTPIVLLHGGPGAPHHYFHPYLSRAKGFAEIIYYDQRGCGISEYKAGEGYSIDQAVDDLDRLRAALEINEWVVLGHSYGGTLAQCYAIKYPERVAGLVLVGSAFYGLPVKLAGTRQNDYVSNKEAKRIREIFQNESLSVEQQLFNAHLNGDWKRQNFYRPSREQLARMARYEWQQDSTFRGRIGQSLNALDFSTTFDQCPLPTLIMEGKWDLTWPEDKPEALHSCFPGSSLVVFDSAGHSPFADEPEKFFATLKEFITTLPEVPDGKVSLWKSRVAQLRQELETSPEYRLKTSGWGKRSSKKIAAAYSGEWRSKLNDPVLLLKAGFALYDCEKYEEALGLFEGMADKSQGDSFALSVALIWQGHILDLLGRRDEAVSIYKKVVQMKVTGRMEHSQYGLAYSPSTYAQERLAVPFSRIENGSEE